jgi:hypothetical protein
MLGNMRITQRIYNARPQSFAVDVGGGMNFGTEVGFQDLTESLYVV